MLLINNATGKATRVDVRPLTIEGMLRSVRRDHRLMIGYLLESLLVAARKLDPDDPGFDRRMTEASTPKLGPKPEPPKGPFVPVWRRRREDKDGQGLVEYALILALISIIAIVALIFIGQQVQTVLSEVGTSVGLAT